MKKVIISMVLVLFLMPLLAVGADKIPPKQKLPEKNVAEKEHSESPAEQLKAKEEDGKQSRIKESVVKRLNQIAEKIEIYSKKPKESMAKITDAWIEKRRSEIWNPLLDKLAEKKGKNPDSETIRQEIRDTYDKLLKDLNKEAEIRKKLKIATIVNEWALGKEEEKLTEEEKRLKKAKEQKEKEEREKALNELQNAQQGKARRRDPAHEQAAIQLGNDVVTIQDAIDSWSEKRKIAIWNQALDQLVTRTWEESNDAKIQKEIDKYFDELTEKLNKEENIKAKLDKVTDEIFFNFLLMMSW